MQNLEKYAILNTYNTNCALSQVLLSERNGTVVKYIYGVGLIGEERHGYFQTYHYDYRGSTVAITNECGELTFTFEYDTYGKLLNEYDYSDAIFLYNGRDGVITDKNGLVYMRARYYSPEMKRFINADIIPGEISNAITLNRYAYANGNPVSNIDPFGLASEDRTGGGPTALEAAYMAQHIYGATVDQLNKYKSYGDWILINIVTNAEGLKIGAYQKTINGITSYAIVNAGSLINVFDDLNGVVQDWKNNFQQLFGYSDDMKDSIIFADQFVAEHPGANITFVGHSKGGAEAVANAVKTNENAIIFNPATVNLGAYNLNADNYTADMTAYVVDGEALNTLFSGISKPIDDFELIGEDSLLEKGFQSVTLGSPVGVIYGIIEALADHGMGAVINALIEEGDK